MSAGRFSRHATLNSLIKQTLGSSCLQCSTHVDCTELMANAQTVLPLFLGKWVNSWCGMTVVDALAPSRLNQGSLCNPGTTATKAEARKIEKYSELIDNGYIFHPVALEVQGSLGESSEIFITRLCKMLCRSNDDQRAGTFLKPRISMVLQIGNAACVLETASDICVRRNLLHIAYFLNLLYHCSFKKFLPVDWDSGWYE